MRTPNPRGLELRLGLGLGLGLGQAASEASLPGSGHNVYCCGPSSMRILGRTGACRHISGRDCGTNRDSDEDNFGGVGGGV